MMESNPLVTETVIYARQCQAKEIAPEVAKRFLQSEHRQGMPESKIIGFGLFHDEELVGVLAISHPRTSGMAKKYSREILRLSFKKNIRVVGGASKLVKEYIKQCAPSDFFTYQDTTGEHTTVYEHCGMTLVGQSKKKEYLVAPGKTLTTATRKEALGMAYATRYGPDRILGTRLGEIFHPDGRRKSNKEIFLEDLGWHIETTSGDRVYEWMNPNYTFYTYKITASDSDKYYYGVSHVKKANATVEDCLNDGYWGSGGAGSQNKFSNWKKAHRHALKKEILSTHPRKSYAYDREKELVGDLYKTDRNCLNSCAGGKDGGVNDWKDSTRISTKTCSTHGASKHIGNHCRKCLTNKNKIINACKKHGETVFFGDSCCKCVAENKNTTKLCPRHGLTKFQGNTCYKCMKAKTIVTKECTVHGLTKFSSDTCLKCALKSEIRECLVHGETRFVGSACAKCRNSQMTVTKTCTKHGDSSFRGGKCYKCFGENSVSLHYCPSHGEGAKHRNGKCCKCTYAEKNKIEMAECSFHGLFKHFKGQCYKCRAIKSTHARLHKDIIVHGCNICEHTKGEE